MEISSLKAKIENLKAGTVQSPLYPPHCWSTVEPWITDYLLSNPVEIRTECIKGSDCSPKAVFARISESAGCTIQFLDDGVSFIFI